MSMLPLLGQPAPRELRDYQARAIDLLRDSLRAGHRRPVMMAPTGWGKTVLASHVVRMALERGKRVVFCVPAIDLIDQTLHSFWADGIGDIGVIQADHIETDWSRPVQIASVQTLVRRGYPKTDLVIVDECHRRFKAISKWMKAPAWQSVPFVGLSATPWSKGLGLDYDDLVVSATTQELIDAGHLSKFRVFAPSHPNLDGVRTVKGDYHEGDLAEAMNKAPLVADTVETWMRLGDNRPTLCFGVDRAHAKHLQRRFLDAGISCGYQDANTTKEDRQAIKRKFHDGEYKIVCNVGTLTTGVDWDVRCIILARPTKSEILYVQIIGRGLRTANGKDDCVIIDHSDTTLRLGFVTDIHHEHLDNGTPTTQKQQHKEALPKECPKCQFLRPAKINKCPACGFLAEKQSDIAVTEGDLVELTGKSKRRAEQQIVLRGKEIPLDRFFAQLVGHEMARGYKTGWARNQFKAAVGVWPNAYRGVSPILPCEEVSGWIRSRQIAFAKRRDKEASHAAPAA